MSDSCCSGLGGLFEEQRGLVDYFFENLEVAEVERFVQQVESCEGIVFLTGMGKSGIIAKNISQMMVSVGVRAMFLDPVNALHGDVGVIGKQDIVIMFSRSGGTGELVNLIPAVRAKGAWVEVVVSNRGSRMVEMADGSTHLPLKRELCPFDLAPTTSSVIQLIFGNTVVAHLMRERGLTKEEYAKNHPAGRIGKRLTVRVCDVMRGMTELPICQVKDRLIGQVGKMSKMKCGCLLVVDDRGEWTRKELKGIFTDGDLRRALEADGGAVLEKTMGELMTPEPATTQKDTMAFEAMGEMERVDPTNGKKRVKELPVVDDKGQVEGLLTLHDLVKFGL